MKEMKEKLRTISQEQLVEILEKHKKWLNNKKGGIRVDLSCADLSFTDLMGVNLCFANLSYADLSGADLSYADLSGADLSNANLINSDLNNANLNCANLNGANLRDANLTYANLMNANLRDANLSETNLDFSSIQLCCKDLGIHLDEKLIIQRLYHLLYNVDYSKNVSSTVKDLLLTKELLTLANKFHRVGECKEIKKGKNK